VSIRKINETLARLKGHIGFIRYLKNTSWMMAEHFLRLVAGLFVGIWVARYLGPEQFGLFSYVLAFSAIFGGIAKLGLDGIVVRELVNHPEKRDDYLGTAFWLKILGAMLVIVIMAAVVPFTSNDTSTNTFIFIIAAGLVFQSFEVIEFYFQSQVLAKIVAICKSTQLALSSMIKIYLVLTEAELIYFVLVTAFDALSLAASYAIAYKLQKNQAFYTKFDLNIAKQLLKDSWPLMFSAIVVMIYMRIDQIMIREMLGEYEVGIYSAAVKLSEALYFIPILITASVFPAILNAKKRSEELYNQRLQMLYTFMVWVAIAIALPLTLLSDWLILLLFGQSYQEAAEVLMIHVWSAVFVFLGVASSKWLLVENFTFISFARTFLGAGINIILNLLLIPKYGVAAAAIATLISQLSAVLIFDAFNSRTKLMFKQKLWAFLWKIR